MAATSSTAVPSPDSASGGPAVLAKTRVRASSPLHWPRVGVDVPISLDCIGETGCIYDNSQRADLYYLRARYYDPSSAQFLSRDPLVDKTRSPYDYVRDNPVNAIDPLGLEETPSSVQITINRIEGLLKNLLEDNRGIYQKAMEGDEACQQDLIRHVERIKYEQDRLEKELGRVEEGDATEAELEHAQYQLEIDAYGDLLPETLIPQPAAPPAPEPAPAEPGSGGTEIPFVPGNFGGGGHDVDL